MAIQPTYPGVYIQEVSSGVRTITGVSTSVTAFVGEAKRGPINKAVLIFSYSDFERQFGGISKDSEMSYAVRQYFLNGGSQAVIVRISGTATPATKELSDNHGHKVLTISALEPGIEGNQIEVGVDYNPSDTATFNLRVNYTSTNNPSDSQSEIFSNLSMSSLDSRYVVNIIKQNSKLIKVDRIEGQNFDTPPGAHRPAQTTNQPYVLSGEIAVADLSDIPALHYRFSINLNDVKQDIAIDRSLLSGTLLHDKLNEIATRIQSAVRKINPIATPYRDFRCFIEGIGGPNDPKKLKLISGSIGEGSEISIEAIPSDDFSQKLKLLQGAEVFQASNLFLSGGSETNITDSYTAHIGSISNRTGIYALEGADLFNLLCLPGIEDRGILMAAAAYCQSRRAFLIIDAPKSLTRPTDMSSFIMGVDLPKSDHAAVYYPWIKIADPLNGGALRATSPSGTIAGLYARTDANRGVWKAPAGTDASLVGVQGLTYKLTDGETGLLNPLGVNCLRVFPASGIIAWGTRTLRGDDRLTSEYKYIPVRRTALFIEESLYRGTQWVVFEPNDEPLWAQIRLNIGAFMHNLFRQGAFQGKTPKEAYMVRCDRETTTQNDINLGIVNILVGFAPLKPAEFVMIKIQQLTGQIDS